MQIKLKVIITLTIQNNQCSYTVSFINSLFDIGNDFGEDEDFEILDNGEHNADDDKFDETVGALQELLIDPEFEKMQKSFFD